MLRSENQLKIKSNLESYTFVRYDFTKGLKMDHLYDDYNDFYGDDPCDAADEDNYDTLDGDHESGLASAGFGTDEDYGYYGDDTPMAEDYYGGE